MTIALWRKTEGGVRQHDDWIFFHTFKQKKAKKEIRHHGKGDGGLSKQPLRRTYGGKRYITVWPLRRAYYTPVWRRTGSLLWVTGKWPQLKRAKFKISAEPEAGIHRLSCLRLSFILLDVSNLHHEYSF